MERPKLIGLVALCTMLGGGLFSAAHPKRVVAADGEFVHAERSSKTDLEVSGVGVKHGYIRYEDLLRLPQVTATAVSDENFTEMHTPGVQVTGVALGVLTRKLQIPAADDLLLARALDGYVGPYPTEYVEQHRPILVLRINGMTTTEWAKKTGNEDPGPYLISYENFVPAWHVLAHADRPQVPIEVVELEYKRQQHVFGPIAPPARFAPDSPERAGFAIAKQNCLRCHAAGPYGGTKAGLSWEVLSGLAKMDGTRFAKYVHDPKSVSPSAKMPEHPQYDAATLQALTAYFKSMAKE
jgi:hypothetical protein